jgi:hypothetical protein
MALAHGEMAKAAWHGKGENKAAKWRNESVSMKKRKSMALWRAI